MKNVDRTVIVTSRYGTRFGMVISESRNKVRIRTSDGSERSFSKITCMAHGDGKRIGLNTTSFHYA